MLFIMRCMPYLLSVVSFLLSLAALVVFSVHGFLSKNLPDYDSLKSYEPPVMTRVYASDGTLLREYHSERRVFLPIQVIPDLVKLAFISAEDKNFYNHSGIDASGIARAVYIRFTDFIWGRNRRPQGASTITQQLARNFFLSADPSYERKIREWILARRLETVLSKDRILELYLNKIFLGLGTYGIGAASLRYFNKSVHELSVAQAAYLAALPKAPNNYHPIKYPDRAIERRNAIIRLMAANGYLDDEVSVQAQKEPLVDGYPFETSQLFSAEYFVEEVRRQLLSRYGMAGLYQSGLSVRTTIDLRIQEITRKALMDGIINYDTEAGYRGPVKHISLTSDWVKQLSEVQSLYDVPEWQIAIVLAVDMDRLVIALRPEKNVSRVSVYQVKQGIVPFEYFKWALKERPVEDSESSESSESSVMQFSQPLLKPGDVIWVEEIKAEKSDYATIYRLRQVPEVSGGAMVMEAKTGRVLAVSGGFSFAKSEFNRATQAWRQPGSAFKPFIYAAALDSGYTPSSVIFDGPVEIELDNGTWWRPKNYSDRYFYGPSILRTGIELSRNAMTVRLVYDMGMPLVAEYAKRFGIYDDPTLYLSAALGAKETTLIRMVSAYATIASGGKRSEASFIDRIQDKYGDTIYRHEQRECISCAYYDQLEPVLEAPDVEQVLDPMTAYQITSMMEGVVQRGTGRALKKIGRPVAGKTGSSNDEKDAWFIGFTPNLVVGAYIGFDKPMPMGLGKSGGRVAAPIVGQIIGEALDGLPLVPFHVPKNMKLFLINRNTGRQALPGDKRAVVEAFKPGNSPPENAEVIDGLKFDREKR